jgi:molybdenum cofactor biosynthesis protein B
MLSYEQVGAAAMLSRATAGLIEDRAVFVLPGSPRAVELAMEKLVLPEAGHLLGQMRS